MKKPEIVTAAIAALMSGTLSVEAFADAPERTILDRFGLELDAASIDEIGREYELLLAQSVIDRTQPGRRPGRPGRTGRPGRGGILGGGGGGFGGGGGLGGGGRFGGPLTPLGVDDDDYVYTCLTCI